LSRELHLSLFHWLQVFFSFAITVSVAIK